MTRPGWKRLSRPRDLAAVCTALLLLTACSQDPHTNASSAAVGDVQGPSPHEGRSEVEVDRDWSQRLGLRVEPARVEAFEASARAVATVVPDEARITHLHARVAGWIEQLHVQHVGEALRAGAPVASIFSQELYAAQHEYLLAHAARDRTPQSAVLAASRERLRTLGMSARQIAAIEQRGEPQRTVTISTPHASVVLRRPVPAGTAVDPSTELLTLADLSRVWIVADIAERDAGLAMVGALARVTLPGQPAAIEAAIEFVSPTVDGRSRTLRVRLGADNADGMLRPGMSGTLELAAPATPRLTVPRDAVVDAGTAQFVYVASADTRFEPRPVRLGERRGDRVVVLDGLEEGEPVLVAGVFLVDSESRLLGSGGGTGHAHGSAGDDRRRNVPAPAVTEDDPHRGHR
jgi:membrane fusion protein, copper/silver efflux system